ncbi:MAG TPA: TRAP transporter small permease subunit [Burkholderiales bacterium]|nr:TRAP transporter small permease subunit [Burkholderiales bacterium]
MRNAVAWLRRRAENVAAAMLAVMFAAFIIQIVFRYLFNFPIGWTSELTVVLWLWMVLWGSAFVLTDKEEIRFDLIYSSVPPRVRIAMAIVFALSIVALYAASFPASWAYVAFMKVEKSSYLKIRLDWLYSIYLVFLVAIIARYLWLLGGLLRGRDPEAGDVTKVSSGL